MSTIIGELLKPLINHCRLVDYPPLGTFWLYRSATSNVMSNDFQPGEVVKLKSGGPKMTIEQIDDYGEGPMARCVWFEGNLQKAELFGLAVLKHAEANAPSGQIKPR